MTGSNSATAPPRRHRLAELLSHALDTVPYYAPLARRLHRPAGLEAFPCLSKREYVTHVDMLLSSAFADYPRTDDPDSVTDPRTLIYEYTSGSSGYPLRTYKSPAERTRMGFSLLRKRKAIYPSFSMNQMFGFIHNRTFPWTSVMDSLGNLAPENIERVLRYLRDVERPAVLHGNPMLLLYYADYIESSGFDLGDWRIVFIESVSEPLSDRERAQIGEQFRTRVVNCYGCLECYNVAYECPEGHMHLNENVVVEIVDPKDQRPVREGQPGEVVLTSLLNRAQPFIRYKTGDLARLEDAECPCGNPEQIIVLSGKRKIDYVKLLFKTTEEGLTICGYDFFWSVMNTLALEGRDCVAWFNIVQQELDLFEVQYLPKPDFDPSFCERFAELAREQLGIPARFEFESKEESEVLLINRKARVFRSLLQSD